ncbi:MAG TPA: hypothetical protein VL728_14240 [Cyclobacteriaceae bacterium]|jgi:hypothetical protein|nr:hypothetical protein [Cyclobacteriaceae bacterium]
MIDIIETWSDLPSEVKVFILISLVALCGALLFVIFLFSSRQVKNSLKQKESVLRSRFQGSLNVIMLMESSDEEPAASAQFYLSQLQKDMGESRLAKQVMTDQLIGLKKNLVGASADSLTNVFRKLRLNAFSSGKAASFSWSTRAQGLFELAQMDDKDSFERIKSNLHARNVTVREEAFMALVKLDKDSSLQFLNDYHAPLSQWMEMRIHQHLSNSDKRKLPDFSQWYNHSNLDVALFALNMTKQFRQLNAVQKLIALLDDPNKSKVVLTIDTLGDLDAHEAANPVSSKMLEFWDNDVLSRRIAKTLGKIGYAENHWKVLSGYLTHPNYSVRFEAAQSLYKSGNQAKYILNRANSEGSLTTILMHVEDPLLQS